jgi:hypothetical protein
MDRTYFEKVVLIDVRGNVSGYDNDPYVWGAFHSRDDNYKSLLLVSTCPSGAISVLENTELERAVIFTGSMDQVIVEGNPQLKLLEVARVFTGFTTVSDCQNLRKLNCYAGEDAEPVVEEDDDGEEVMTQAGAGVMVSVADRHSAEEMQEQENDSDSDRKLLVWENCFAQAEINYSEKESDCLMMDAKGKLRKIKKSRRTFMEPVSGVCYRPGLNTEVEFATLGALATRMFNYRLSPEELAGYLCGEQPLTDVMIDRYLRRRKQIDYLAPERPERVKAKKELAFASIRVDGAGKGR